MWEEDKEIDAPISLQSLLFDFTGCGEKGICKNARFTLHKREKKREKYLNSPWKGTSLL